MLKNLPMNFEMLGKLLGLPEGTLVVSCRQASFRHVEFTLVDPEGRLPQAAIFDFERREWLPAEDGAEKGITKVP